MPRRVPFHPSLHPGPTKPTDDQSLQRAKPGDIFKASTLSANRVARSGTLTADGFAMRASFASMSQGVGRRKAVSRLARYLRTLIAPFVLAAASASATVAHAAPALSFRFDEGLNINSFTRDGAVAAHLLLRSSKEPRILVAFPAGNSGVGLWFAATEEPVTWKLVGSPRPITHTDARGRVLRGIEVEAEVDAPALHVERAVLSSIRVLRDFERLHAAPDEVMTPAASSDARLSWTRDRLDGAVRCNS